MSRPFVFRINAAELFSQIQGMNNDEKAVFITQLSIDFITLKASSYYSKNIIEETLQFIEKKRINGSKGGRPITKTKAKVKLNKSKAKAKANPEEETEAEKDKVKRFVPPSLQEVETHITEKNYEVDPAKWFSYYSANGWKVGKNKMVDWKAAIRTWEPKKQIVKKVEAAEPRLML